MLNIPEEHKGKKFYSVSKLGSFHDCLHKFDLVYNKKDRGINNFWGEVGTIVHDIIEKNLRGAVDREDMALEFKKAWSNREYRMFPQMEASYYSKIHQFFQDWTGPSQNVIGIEKEFYIPIDEERVLMGFIDMITEDDQGNITATDWKISKPFSKEDEPVKKRQLLIYARAIKELYGKWPSSLVFYFVKEQSFYHYEFNKEEVVGALNWVKESIVKIESQEEWPDKIMVAKGSGINVNNKKQFDRFFCQNLCPHREGCESLSKLEQGEL